MTDVAVTDAARIDHWRAALGPLGFGGAALGNLYAEVAETAAMATVSAALERGIRYFDTAPYYGHGLSERRLGDALAGVADVAISTKVGRVIEHVDGARSDDGFTIPDGTLAHFDYSRDSILRSVDQSLERLRRDRVEFLLLHDVGEVTHGANHAAMLAQALDQALPTLAEMKAQGVCDAIGIGVNEEAVCLEIMKHADLDLILLAGRYTLLEQASLGGVMEMARQRDVGIIAGGPFNSGLLAPRDRPGGCYDYAPAADAIAASAARIYDIAREHGVDVGAAAIQFPLAHPAVVGVVAGMRSVEEVCEAASRSVATIPPAFWRSMREHGMIVPEAPTS